MSDMEFNKKVKEVENDERLLLFLTEENENKFDVSRILPRFPAPYNGRMSEWFIENMPYILASNNEYCKKIIEQHNNYKDKSNIKKQMEEQAKADKSKKRKDWLIEREGNLSWEIGEMIKPAQPQKRKKTKRYNFNSFDNLDDYASYDAYDEFAEDVDNFSLKSDEHETLDEYLSKYKITEEEFKEAVSSLSEIEQEYLKLYFGFDSEFMPMTIDQIAEFKDQQKKEVKKIVNIAKKKIPSIVKNLRTLHKIKQEKEENPDEFYYVESKKEKPKTVEQPKVKESKKTETSAKKRGVRTSNSPADTMTIATLIRDTKMNYSEIIKAIPFLAPLRKELTMMKCGLGENEAMSVDEIAIAKNMPKSSVRDSLDKVPTDLIAIKEGGYKSLKELAYEARRKNKDISYKDELIEKIGKPEEEILKVIPLLPDSQQKCFKSMFVDNKSKKEIAVENKISEAGVTSNINYAIKNITKYINDGYNKVEKTDKKLSNKYKRYLKEYGKTDEQVEKALPYLPEVQRRYFKLVIIENNMNRKVAAQEKVSLTYLNRVIALAKSNIATIINSNYEITTSELEHSAENVTTYSKELEINEELLLYISLLPERPRDCLKYTLNIGTDIMTEEEIMNKYNIDSAAIASAASYAERKIKSMLFDPGIIDFIGINASLNSLIEIRYPGKTKKEFIDALDILINEEKELIKLFFGIGTPRYTLKEIAEKKSISKHEVKKVLYNALDNLDEILIHNNMTNIDTLDEVCSKNSISEEDFVLIVRGFEGARKTHTCHYYGIDLEKLSLEEIANKYNTTVRYVQASINGAIKTVKEISVSEKVYDAKLKGLRDKLKLIYETMEKDEEFKKKAILVSYPGIVAISLINNFNFKVEQVRIALGYNNKQEVINLLLLVCEALNQEEDNNYLKPNDNYKDDSKTKDSVYKLEGKN